MVVFAATCAEVDFLHKVFSHAFWPDNDANGRPLSDDAAREPLLNTSLSKLHGNMLQADRTKTYFSFCEASTGILFCTDVGMNHAIIH